MSDTISGQWADLLKAVESQTAGSAQKLHDLGALIGKQLDKLEADGALGVDAARSSIAKTIAKV